LKNGPETRRKSPGVPLHPADEFIRRQPASLGDLPGMKAERAFMAETVHFDKLVTGGRARRDFGKKARLRSSDAQFLLQFAHGRGGVVFTGVEMAAGRGVPL